MPIEQTPGGISITGANSIRYFRLITLRSALELHAKGIRVSRVSPVALAKRELGVTTGTAKTLLPKLEAYIAAEYPNARSAQ